MGGAGDAPKQSHCLRWGPSGTPPPCHPPPSPHERRHPAADQRALEQEGRPLRTPTILRARRVPCQDRGVNKGLPSSALGLIRHRHRARSRSHTPARTGARTPAHTLTSPPTHPCACAQHNPAPWDKREDKGAPFHLPHEVVDNVTALVHRVPRVRVPQEREGLFAAGRQHLRPVHRRPLGARPYLALEVQVRECLPHPPAPAGRGPSNRRAKRRGSRQEGRIGGPTCRTGTPQTHTGRGGTPHPSLSPWRRWGRPPAPRSGGRRWIWRP